MERLVRRLSSSLSRVTLARDRPPQVEDEDAIDLPVDDFRRLRRYLAPWMFALLGGEEGKTYPPPWELIGKEDWDGIMVLPTDVALKSSSYEGDSIARLHKLHSDWIFSWPEVGEAPFIEQLALLAGEEFDTLVFNALHGWYRQAIGCLRNALETLTIGAGLAVRGDTTGFEQWRAGTKEYKFGNAREFLRDSKVGGQIDADAAPGSVFGDAETSGSRAVTPDFAPMRIAERATTTPTSGKATGRSSSRLRLESSRRSFETRLHSRTSLSASRGPRIVPGLVSPH